MEQAGGARSNPALAAARLSGPRLTNGPPSGRLFTGTNVARSVLPFSKLQVPPF